MTFLLPIAIIASVIGLALVVKSAWLMKNPSAPSPTGSRVSNSSGVERFAVGFCAGVAAAGLVAMLVSQFRRPATAHPGFFVFLGVVLLLAAPAVAWRTAWRVPAEGVATVALSAVTAATGFSIGVVFVPLLIAMVVICVQHLRGSRSFSG